MPHDTLLLIGRETGRATYETHAERLRSRAHADEVAVETYAEEPRRELRASLSRYDTDRVFAVPMSVAHTRETLDAVPAALDSIDAPVRYCEPPGRSPLVTDALADRAGAEVPLGADTSVALVAFGASGTPYQRQVTERHAARLRERTPVGEVEPCYLLQNPTAECVRYNLTRDRAVAVPLFFTASDATARRIPAALDLDRGGLAYAEPLGDHALVTDAVAAAVETERAVADSAGPSTFEATLTATTRPMATDGEG